MPCGDVSQSLGAILDADHGDIARLRLLEKRVQVFGPKGDHKRMGALENGIVEVVVAIRVLAYQGHEHRSGGEFACV